MVSPYIPPPRVGGFKVSVDLSTYPADVVYLSFVRPNDGKLTYFNEIPSDCWTEERFQLELQSAKALNRAEVPPGSTYKDGRVRVPANDGDRVKLTIGDVAIFGVFQEAGFVIRSIESRTDDE